jgi:hypothetical protein
MAWSFDNAGLSKEGDHLQSIADSIVKDLKPTAEHE